jgi:hypothetical protein
MRSFSGLFTCAVAVTLACSSGAACSSERVLPPGVGGAADLGSTVVAQAEAAVGVGVGPSLPPPPIPTAWDVHYGDAADQTVSAAAVDDAGDIALVGTVEGAIDLGNITWPGSTTARRSGAVVTATPAISTAAPSPTCLRAACSSRAISAAR